MWRVFGKLPRTPWPWLWLGTLLPALQPVHQPCSWLGQAPAPQGGVAVGTAVGGGVLKLPRRFCKVLAPWAADCLRCSRSSSAWPGQREALFLLPAV